MLNVCLSQNGVKIRSIGLTLFLSAYSLAARFSSLISFNHTFNFLILLIFSSTKARNMCGEFQFVRAKQEKRGKCRKGEAQINNEEEHAPHNLIAESKLCAFLCLLSLSQSLSFTRLKPICRFCRRTHNRKRRSIFKHRLLVDSS